MLKLYNTLTRKKEEFQPIRQTADKKVGFYCCGPTVYWYAHLGNFRTYIFADILRRILEYNGYKVNYIMNYTDVGHLTSNQDSGDDKMEKSAKREGKTAWEIADFYIKAFKKNAEALNILKPTQTPRATDHIDDQIELIKILEEKGFTYKTKDGIYFDTSKLKNYGKLAMLDAQGLKAGARVEMAEGKKNPTDFALWKFSPKDKKRQMEWNSPWTPPGVRGKVKGFPGWHIECSAMSRKYLGEQFDIHGGAIDLIPIHHTNEIAQSEAAYGKIPARFWMHGEFLLIDEGKMGKSEGNIFTLKTLIDKGFNPLAYRYLVLTAHYRSKLNFTWQSLEAAQNALNNLYQAFSKYPEDGKISREYKKEFEETISDDLDMPKAMALVWKLIKDEKVSDRDKKQTLLDFDKVLGLGLDKIKKIEIPDEIKRLVKQREKLRQEKKWKEADEVRKKIDELGYQIEDTKEGPEIKKGG